jgi:mRNA-degrading endonuclease RelE of RelBE toxin-antitoxin system
MLSFFDISNSYEYKLRPILINEKWYIEPTKKLGKQIEHLPERVRLNVFSLLKDLEEKGPNQLSWPNYSALKKVKKFQKTPFTAI